MEMSKVPTSEYSNIAEEKIAKKGRANKFRYRVIYFCVKE